MEITWGEIHLARERGIEWWSHGLLGTWAEWNEVDDMSLHLSLPQFLPCALPDFSFKGMGQERNRNTGKERYGEWPWPWPGIHHRIKGNYWVGTRIVPKKNREIQHHMLQSQQKKPSILQEYKEVCDSHQRRASHTRSGSKQHKSPWSETLAGGLGGDWMWIWQLSGFLPKQIPIHTQ